MAEAILEIPGVRQRISRLSVLEYHRLGELNQNGRRTELIRGFVIEKISKPPLHRLICSRLYRLLLSRLPAGFTVWKEEPLTLADSEPEPDLSVTRGSEDSFASRHPSTAELVVEVAVSNPALDQANASLYAEANIREYWIILAGEQRVEIYLEPQDGRYLEKRCLTVNDLLTSAVFPSITIAVEELFLKS